MIKSTEKQLRIERTEIIREIKSQCKHLFNKDYTDMGLTLIRFDGINGILKCNHIEKENAIKLLQSIQNISSYKVQLKTVGTSGTIKALINKYMTL